MNQPFYLIAGLGRTGYSIASYLMRRHELFILFDTRKNVEGLARFQADFPGVDVFLESLPANIYPQLRGIIASPGIALEEPFIQQAIAFNIPLYGDIECFAREVKTPVIAITGTNGKSTVTTLVGEMARAAGLSVAVAGNIGLPVLDLLDDDNHYDIWVLELSSFQLELTHSLAPLAATILNISADHLDRHHSLPNYCAAKQRIYRQAALQLYNRDELATYPLISQVETKKISYGLDEGETQDWGISEQNGALFLAQGKHCLLGVDQLRIKGRHNWQNALAASALAYAAGIDFPTIAHVLQVFSGLPHRCQWVRTIDAVEWINDSKGTNIGATLSAIAGIGHTLSGKIILIAGGLGKGADFKELQQPVAKHVRSVVLLGTDAKKIADALMSIVPVELAVSMEQAVQLARLQARPGDVVLLSPACASMDMFRDFNHRGELFTELVSQL